MAPFHIARGIGNLARRVLVQGLPGVDDSRRYGAWQGRAARHSSPSRVDMGPRILENVERRPVERAAVLVSAWCRLGLVVAPAVGVLVLASGFGPAVGMVALVLGDLADGSAVVAVLATNGVLILGDLGHGLAVRVGRRVGGRGGLGRRLGIGVGRRVGAALSLRRIAILVRLARDVGDVTAVVAVRAARSVALGGLGRGDHPVAVRVDGGLCGSRGARIRGNFRILAIVVDIVAIGVF